MTDVKDILIIVIGQAGINIAERFWKYTYESLGLPFIYGETDKETDIDKKLSDILKITEFYSEKEIEEARRLFFYNLLDEKDRDSGKPKKYIPRTIFIDVEIQPIRNFLEKYKRIFPKESFIYSTYGSASMFARAERFGKHLELKLQDRINTMITSRAIQNLEGVVIIHATGGGAGSGLLTNVFNFLKSKFFKVPILMFTILPSKSISGNVIEAYNSIYAFSCLLKNADASIILDNEKLIQIIREKYKISSPTYADINLIVSRLIFSILMQFAMPGATMRMDFNKLFTNLVPYKYMKFVIPAISPFKFDDFSRNLTKDIVEELTNGENFLVDCNVQTGKFTSAVYMFMGKLGPEVQGFIKQAKKDMPYMDWITTGTSIALTPREKMTLDGKNLHRQGIILANNSAVSHIFKRILSQYKIMKSKGAFLSHFMRENIDSIHELEKAERNVIRMLKFYEIAEKS